MNQVFKVIFNKTIGDYVVCSENMKNRKNKTRSAAILTLISRSVILGALISTSVLATPNFVLAANVVDDFNSLLAGNGQTNAPYIFTNIDYSFASSNPLAFTVSSVNNTADTALLQFGLNSSVNISTDAVIKFTGDGGIAIRNSSGLTNILAKEVSFLGAYSTQKDNGTSAALLVTGGKLSFGSRNNPIQKFKLENGAGHHYYTQGITVGRDGELNIYSNSIDISSYTGSATIYSEGIVNIYSDNLVISNTKYNEANTKALQTGGGVVNIFSDSVSMSTMSHSPVYAVGQSTININARKIEAHAKGNLNGYGFSSNRNSNVALLAHVGGTINLVGEEITLTAPNDGKSGQSAIVTSQGSSINVSATKKIDVNGDVGNYFVGLDSTKKGQIVIAVSDNAEMNLHGNVDLKAGSGGDTVILKAGSGSKIQTKGDIVTNDSPSNAVNIVLGQSAQWSIEGNKVELHELKAEGGYIDISKTASDAQISIDNITGTSANIAIDSANTAKIDVQNISARINVQASGQMNDNTENKNELLDILSAVIRTNDVENVSLSAQEGLISDAFTAEITEDGVAMTSQTKNVYLQAVSSIIENQTIEFRSQINDVNKRMGDLRTDGGTAGAWARIYGGKNKYKADGVTNRYRTVQIGADASLRGHDGRFYMGLTGLYNEGDSSLKNGSADDESFGGGVYGGYLADNGWYLDVIAKYLRMKNDFAFSYTNGRVGKGRYETNGVAASVETGWRLTNEYGVFVEPQFECMVGHVMGFKYDTSAGVHVENDSMNSLITRFGLSLGKVFDEGRGSAYLNVSILNDYDGQQSATYTVSGRSRKADIDIGGAWFEAALGATYHLSDNFYLYGELATSKGTEVDNPFQWNVGARLSF